MSHSQDPEGGANFAAKLLSGTVIVETPDDGAAVAFAVLLVPGLGDWQATPVLSVDLFVSIQVSQLHESAGGAKFFIKLVSALTDFDGVNAGLTPGFGVSQAIHFVLLASLLSIQESQDQDPAAGANFCIKSLFVGAGFLGGAGLPVEGLDD